MGWDGTHKPKTQPLSDFITDIYDSERGEVIGLAVVHRATAYLAYRRFAYVRDGVSYPERVTAKVVLLRWGRGYYNVHYKAMGEECGPCESNCPEKILKLLTPTEDQYALEWRARCWENIGKRKARPKFKFGDRIILTNPIKFTDGHERQFLTVVSTKPLRFKDTQGYYVRLLQRTLNTPTEYKYFPAH